jgi:hypothetical protein
VAFGRNEKRYKNGIILKIGLTDQPSLIPLIIFLLEPLRLFFLPKKTSSAI